ncbi:hypothetical protein RTBOTA2_004862, partial [Rhodotorula toruloides]
PGARRGRIVRLEEERRGRRTTGSGLPAAVAASAAAARLPRSFAPCREAASSLEPVFPPGEVMSPREAGTRRAKAGEVAPSLLESSEVYGVAQREQAG